MASNEIRRRRLSMSNGAIVMVPLDHGVSVGPIAGLEDPRVALQAAAQGGASCVTVHKGLVPLAAPFADRLGILMHLSASSDTAADPHDKRLVATVEEALRRGCDGVSIHINVGSATESRQLEEAGRVATACADWGAPLITMAYPRGPKVTDPHDPKLLAHAARVAAELGADAVKLPFSGSVATYRDVVQGCPVPILVAGGLTRGSFDAVLKDLKAAKKAGAQGCSIGRNVFQNADPAKAVAAVAAVFA
ncbi:MAG: 2-amino-3,7-dideoxy-D-threo-hept-6-ulosonate synthase [Thermoplasmatota archaeon]